MKCPKCGSGNFFARLHPQDDELTWNEKEEQFIITLNEPEFNEDYWQRVEKVRCADCGTEIPLEDVKVLDYEFQTWETSFGSD